VKEYVGGGDSPYITLYYRSFDGEQGANTTSNSQNKKVGVHSNILSWVTILDQIML
jgi:hypothetical protein